MRERALPTLVLALALVLGLPRCGFRMAGLEVSVVVQPAPGTPSGRLDLERLELVPCQDVPTHIARAWRALGIARAHDIGAPAAELALPSGLDARVLSVTPDTYCGVRLAVGSADRVALELVTGAAEAREVVLPLLDASGGPTRITLARAGDAADLTVALGAFTDGDTPLRALDHILDRATATARMRAPRAADGR
jgi:hypothetical protein